MLSAGGTHSPVAGGGRRGLAGSGRRTGWLSGCRGMSILGTARHRDGSELQRRVGESAVSKELANVERNRLHRIIWEMSPQQPGAQLSLIQEGTTQEPFHAGAWKGREESPTRILTFPCRIMEGQRFECSPWFELVHVRAWKSMEGQEIACSPWFKPFHTG